MFDILHQNCSTTKMFDEKVPLSCNALKTQESRRRIRKHFIRHTGNNEHQKSKTKHENKNRKIKKFKIRTSVRNPSLHLAHSKQGLSLINEKQRQAFRNQFLSCNCIFITALLVLLQFLMAYLYLSLTCQYECY